MPISWDAFLTRYGPMAHALAKSLARPPVSPEDVVQEASLALLRAQAQEPGKFQGNEHARNYFLRTVRNLALKTRRSAERERPLEIEPAAREGSTPAAQAALERQHALARILRELDPESRDLIARRFLERQTLARIAGETGVPVSTLHGREKALLQALRRRLAALDQEAAG